MTPFPPTVFDLGAQLERTSLAWMRTALALAAVGALLGRSAVRVSTPAAGLAVAAAVAGTGLLFGVSAARSYGRRHAALHAGRPPTPPVPLAWLSSALTLTATAALAVVLA
jgi:putative membrane protein